MNTSLLTNNAVELLSEEIVFASLINCYLREYTCWHKFYAVPQFDETLAAYFTEKEHDKWIKIIPADGVEIYCPVKYFSPSGRHVFKFPIISRNVQEDVISEIDLLAFVELISLAYENSQAEKEILKQRIEDSVTNMTIFIEDHLNRGEELNLNRLQIPFIEAEQLLFLGHPMHPVAKSRMGFSQEDLINYSPETAKSFQLHFFLADPQVVLEKSAINAEMSSELRKMVLESKDTPEPVKDYIQMSKDKLIPCHPWEAEYLLNNTDVKAHLLSGRLEYIGAAGPLFSATSSVRTVYSQEADYMYKLSLHVKITNSERVNLERELYRGYDISRLMSTSWGEQLRRDFPDMVFMTDPGFMSIVSARGELIEGFNTVVRKNIFKGEAANKNVTLLASLCQDGIEGRSSRLAYIVATNAERSGASVADVSKQWFAKYLELSIGQLVRIYNRYGLACEAHQQNVLLELDEAGFPKKLYFRDNQGYFFRSGKADELHSIFPDLAELSSSIIPEDYIHPKYNYYLLINNILGIVNAFGISGHVNEYDLLDILCEELSKLQAEDTTGLVKYILESRDWSVKANLQTSLQNKDEARAPIDNPAVYLDFPNPLMYKFFCSALIKPTDLSVSYSRYFEELDMTFTMRPFDLKKDLTMVHKWFNQEHTKQFWKMDGPIKDLEAFYIMLMETDHTHSFIGEVDGVPTFTVEPYWPMRDVVGKCYEALPNDYGAHLLIAPTDKNKKFTMQCAQTLMEFIFNQPEVGKCIGEADVNSKPMHILVTRLGFKLQKVIQMPTKMANLTFCYRDWYKERFPKAQI